MSLDDVGDLCQGYSAVVAPATTTVRSGLACVFADGVVIHRQQILWPGKIIAALAREKGAWILGDLNISEESAKDLASGLPEILAELLDQADLVGVATFFDASLEHTRVATIGSRVNARRLDRILLPSSFCDCVTQYQTIDYAYSDHRVVLIQVGDPAHTILPCIGKLLRSDLFFDRLETFIDEVLEDLANLSSPMLWEHWTRIKVDLVAEIRSLAPAVAQTGGGYIERASLFLRWRLEDDTARSDYPSLSDLGRSLRARRRSPSTFTDDDGNTISGGQLRRFLLERLSSRFAQDPSSEEAIADFLAEVTPLEFDEWDQLFLADIARDQIAAAIHRLLNGRDSGWNGLPCEFVKPLKNSSPEFFGKSSRLLDFAGPYLHPQNAARSSCCRKCTVVRPVCDVIFEYLTEPPGHPDMTRRCHLFGPEVGLRHPEQELSVCPAGEAGPTDERSGRPSTSTTPEKVDKVLELLKKKLKGRKFQSIEEIKVESKKVMKAIPKTDYQRTISRRLVANGLHSCRPLRRLPLTPPNRRQRLEWCRARSTWMSEWHRVVFSDESRFCLSSDSRRVRVWRRRGERSNPAAIVERPTVRQRGIMVWGAIAYDSRSPLLRIQGTMTAQRYVDDVLRPVTLPYLQGVPNALYQQDNARPHTARISQQALQDVQMLPWPPYSPDLSPIEHVWDIIGRRLHALPQPRSEDELWQMVERE
ncbi:hypothetical protein LAZ67_3001226 [Cordylochernes scorpioides]|uniref:Transposable element Tcb1 transposase n=1 Tax=Cordylochernes scorpioides TaxID=51811 RepID=A0ABY6K8I8_9ARAC|nr:hypothetical protein LAZ67_3001226 [Cordylochernes scorpioides]